MCVYDYMNAVWIENVLDCVISKPELSQVETLLRLRPPGINFSLWKCYCVYACMHLCACLDSTAIKWVGLCAHMPQSLCVFFLKVHVSLCMLEFQYPPSCCLWEGVKSDGRYGERWASDDIALCSPPLDMAHSILDLFIIRLLSSPTCFLYHSQIDVHCTCVSLISVLLI